jgi:hypothetical protein
MIVIVCTAGFAFEHFPASWSAAALQAASASASAAAAAVPQFRRTTRARSLLQPRKNRKTWLD